jgi:molybdopterin-guanine dinucleotide biosynthesis protein A
MFQFTVAILAGGKSSRMGTDKAFADLMGRPMIEHTLSGVAGLGQTETILITNRPADYARLNLPMIGDILPGKGSLGGVYTAIARGSGSHTLVLGCDMPFVSPALLRHMVELSRDEAYDAIVPRSGGYPEALHAIYSRACLVPIQERLEANQLKVTGFFESVRVRYVDEAEYQALDPKGLSFFNVNTPDDLAAALRLAERA